jgi:hypothetical protein
LLKELEIDGEIMLLEEVGVGGGGGRLAEGGGGGLGLLDADTIDGGCAVLGTRGRGGGNAFADSIKNGKPGSFDGCVAGDGAFFDEVGIAGKGGNPTESFSEIILAKIFESSVGGVLLLGTCVEGAKLFV